MGIALVVAFVASLALTPAAGRLAWRCGAVSHPDGGRKRHARSTALWGGLAVFAAWVAGGLTGRALSPDLAADPLFLPLALSAAAMCVLGACDDRWRLSPRTKLAGEIAALAPALLAGGHIESMVVFGWELHLGGAGIAVTAAWLILGINAVNLVDGMDALASTIVGVGAACAAAIAAATGQPALALSAALLAAALLGFAIHNRPPATIYLGDCGSLMAGFLLAWLALEISHPAARTADLGIAALVLLVPLLDTALAIVRRRLKRLSIAAPDYGHVHHQLLLGGFGVWAVLGILGGLALTAGLLACGAAALGRPAWAWGAIGLVIAAMVRFGLLARQERELIGALAARWTGRRAVEPEIAVLAFPRREEPSEQRRAA